MFRLYITTVRVDGSQDEVKLSMPSQLEFEAIEKVTLYQAIDENPSQHYLNRLSWLASKQAGLVVPATLEEYAKGVEGVGYRVEKIPFSQADTTPGSPPSSEQESPTPN